MNNFFNITTPLISRNYSNADNLKNKSTINFKGPKTLLPPEIEDIFIHSTLSEKKKIIDSIAIQLGCAAAMVINAFGLEKFMNQKTQNKELKFIEYPTKLPANTSVILPNGESMNLESSLYNAEECYEDLPIEKEIMIIFDPSTNKKEFIKMLPNIKPETYLNQNLDYKNILTIHNNEDDSWNIWSKTSDFEERYFAEPNSFEQGRSNIVQFEDIPTNKEISIMSEIPYKFVELPKGSKVEINGENNILDTDSVLIYKYPNQLELMKSSKFIENYKPTNNKSEELFNNIYTKIYGVNLTDETENQDDNFNTVSKGDEISYTKGNLTVSNRYYEFGHSYNTTIKQETLDKIANLYDKELEKNPNLKKYKVSIVMDNTRNGVKIEAILTKKNQRPWNKEYITINGSVEDGNYIIDLSNIK